VCQGVSGWEGDEIECMCIENVSDVLGGSVKVLCAGVCEGRVSYGRCVTVGIVPGWGRGQGVKGMCLRMNGDVLGCEEFVRV
jgi:hypothetical protein